MVILGYVPDLLPEVKKLLKPSVISDVGALLENAHDLLIFKRAGDVGRQEAIGVLHKFWSIFDEGGCEQGGSVLNTTIITDLGYIVTNATTLLTPAFVEDTSELVEMVVFRRDFLRSGIRGITSPRRSFSPVTIGGVRRSVTNATTLLTPAFVEDTSELVENADGLLTPDVASMIMVVFRRDFLRSGIRGITSPRRSFSPVTIGGVRTEQEHYLCHWLSAV
jgi:hypothetical protein